MTILASDDFNRANGVLGANWTTITGLNAPDIISNTVEGGIAECGARYSGSLVGGGAWPADGYATVVIGAAGGVTDNGCGPVYRCASDGSAFYFAQANTTETKLYKFTGSFNQLGTDGAAAANGDTITITVSGGATTHIVVSKNGSAIVTFDDSSSPITAAGSAGIWVTHTGVATIDSFEGGDLAAGGGQAPRSVHVFNQMRA